MRRALIVPVLLAAAALAGCGNKGPLVRPAAPAPASSSAALPAPAASVAPAPASGSG